MNTRQAARLRKNIFVHQYWVGDMPPFINLALQSVKRHRGAASRWMWTSQAVLEDVSRAAAKICPEWSHELFMVSYKHEHHADLLRWFLLSGHGRGGAILDDNDCFVWVDADMVAVKALSGYFASLEPGFYSNFWGGRPDNDVMVASGSVGVNIAKHLFRHAVKRVIKSRYSDKIRPFIGRNLLSAWASMVRPLDGQVVSWGRGFAKLWDEYSPDPIAPALDGAVLATLLNSESREYLGDKSAEWLTDDSGHTLIQKLFVHAFNE